MRHEARITIWKNITQAELYTRSNGEKWSLKRTGTGVPWSKRNDLKRIKALTYSIPPGEELLIYERDNFDYDFNIPGLPGLPAIQFGFTERVLQEQYLESNADILPSVLFGFLILAALFNIYFFIITRECVYLLFSLTLLARTIASFLYDTDILFREHPITKWYLTLVFALFYFLFWIHFVRYYLETFKYVPRWDKLLIGLSVYTLFIWFLLLGHFNRNEEPGVGIIMLITFITFLLFIRPDNKAIRWRIVAILPAIGILIIPLFSFLLISFNKYSGRPIPSFLTWLSSNFSPLEQIGFIWLLVFFSWSLFERYQQLQKRIAQETLAKERLAKEKEIERNRLIAQQNEELEEKVIERTSDLKRSLEELKSTQAQLVQREKMASLGELTAGIAHEIQNPLNFVNNFSEINAELIDELQNEVNSGNKEQIKAISDEIRHNEEKITYHGKRADSIVKGMLQHSRASTGEKEPTNINAFVDECLRLSYHGQRAKDKSFNAKLETELDPSVGKLNVIPQDITRVLVNLFNNALYSVSEKKKHLDGMFEPVVSVTTKKIDSSSGTGGVEITVRDNGPGIPQKALDKIFQPFFTTKPTGEGTGLGLSLSYDIITKGHGGEIKVDTKEGEYAEFTVLLPGINVDLDTIIFQTKTPPNETTS